MTDHTHRADDRQSLKNQLLAAYRHYLHELRGEAHVHAPTAIAGVPVNQAVPMGANGDAAVLSRPRGEPTATDPDHEKPYRLSVRTGKSQYASVTQQCVENTIRDGSVLTATAAASSLQLEGSADQFSTATVRGTREQVRHADEGGRRRG